MRRVVVTGLGVVSCLGNNQEEVHQSLLNTKSGISFSEEYKEHNLKSHVHGKPYIKLEDHIDRKTIRFMGSGSAYNYIAMKEAIEDSGLEESEVSNFKTGIVMGSGGPSIENVILAADKTRAKTPKLMGPFIVPRTMASTASATLAVPFKIKGTNYTMSSACATSGHCIGNSMELIQMGKQDVIFAGGSEEIHWAMTDMFEAMTDISSKNKENPEPATRSYEKTIEGLVIHNLKLDDRSIFYRASMSDMVVPYGSADPMHSWKAVHDGTEYGFGALASSLTLGCDCLGEIYYFDGQVLSFDGSVGTIENAICLHEEDYGVQWKHSHTIGEGFSEVRRSRRLVISSFSAVGNYDYGIFWYLYLDGTIELEMKLTGIVGVSTFDEKTHNPAQDMKVTRELVSPIHQHLFNVRIDWFLDGGKNNLIETNVERLPMGENNPHGTQFQAVSTLLEKESDAKRNIAPEQSRVWKIVNPNKKNSVGGDSAYKFLPGNSPVLLSDPSSPSGKRACFARHNLWATPFQKEEISGGGRYTVMHSGQGGLDEMTAQDRDITNCDLVTWHTFGVTHLPRPEDWPVMPVEYCGFHLIPSGFFDKNPTINLPPSCKKGSTED